MTFGAPLWLLGLLAALPALVLLYAWSGQRVRRRLHRFAAGKLAAALTANHSPRRQRFKLALVLLAVALLFGALARPQWGVVLEESEARGIDLMIALDTSRSMLAEDVRPNRLERAKLAVLDLAQQMRGDRVGLIAFAGEAFLQCPLTLDYDAFRATLAATDTEIIAQGGTNIARAIAEAQEALGGDRNFKLLVLITDGEDLEASGVAAAEAAAEDGLRIFTVGIGGTEGEPIPIRDPQGNLSYLRDASGNIVRTALDETTLKRIAAVSDGYYTPLTASGGLEAIYERLLEELPAEELGTRIQEVPLERFAWPVAAALILLFLEPLLGTRRRGQAAPNLARLSVWLPFLGALFFAFAAPADASPAQALALYEKGRYEDSAEAWRAAIANDPDDPRLQYNLGNALYRLEDWDAARAAFEAALRTRDPAHQADAFFNLGNTLYQQGLATPETVAGRAERLALWRAALASYANSRALRPQRDDLERNRAVLETAIADLTRELSIAVLPGAEAGTAEPSGRFVRGNPVELEAEAAEGWLFRRWDGAEVEAPTEAATTLILEQDTALEAVFVKTWQLDVRSADEAQGTAAESGIYPEDEPVTITATPTEPYVFKRWEASEGAALEAADEAETQLQLTGDATVTAFFVPGFFLEVVPEPTIGGQAGTTGWYEQYTEVPLQAEPREGFAWVGWLGDDIADPTEPQTVVSLNQDERVVAQFDRLWNLIVAENDPQGGSVTGSGDFPLGTTTPITATPNEGYEFTGWQGPGVKDRTAAETEVTVISAEHDVIAQFTQSDAQNEDSQDQQQEQQDPQDQSGDGEAGEPPPPEEGEEPPPDSPEEGEEPPPESDEPNEEEAPEPEDQEGEQPRDEPEPREEEPGADEPAQPEEEEAGEQTGEAQPVPLGEMTEEQARELLNALRESEKKLPASREATDGARGSGRDW